MRVLFRSTLAVTALALLLGGSSVLGRGIDLNANGMSDIWEWVWAAGGLDPNGDADGDGVSNLQESLAGTDPFSPASCPRITAAAYGGTNINVSMPSALGKQYQLQSASLSPSGGLSSWVTEATLVARTGTVVTLTATAGVAAKFFRMAVSDVDTDGDGVSDWEEYQLGLDPTKANSNGQLDGNGQPLSDYAFATGKLAQQNMVTIAATQPSANQPDPGQSALNSGQFTITRGGFPLNAISVNLGLGGPGPGMAVEGVDHAALPRLAMLPAGVSSQTITLTPLANTSRMSPAIATMKVLPGSRYTVGVASNASIVIYPSATPKGTGLTGQYFTNSSSAYSSSANFNPANLVLTRLDPTVDFAWYTNTTPAISNHYYSVRWSGQVQPEYSETYYFDANTDDGVKLWVNDQLIINAWTTHAAADSIGSITLQAGVRYDIKMEYYNFGGAAVAHLSWYSPSQPKQVIPANRFYPSTAAAAPTAVTSPLTAVAFLGQLFNFTVTGANAALYYTATGLPPGLIFNPTNGVISGVPGLAGDYNVSLTASNAVGVAASAVDIQVIDTGSAVAREVWNGVPGINISDIPVTSPANITNMLGTLEGITGYGVNYGERIRGYLTAPVTGNYTFWVAGGDAVELWISNDSEPANKVRRAWVLPSPNPNPPPANGTAPHQWNVQPNQKSPWLALVAGQRYYLEVLHKVGLSKGDNWSVGWLQDPTGTNTTPSGVVPGYVLSPYFALPPSSIPGTLYVATMLAQAGVTNTPVGSATLRLSADSSQAVLVFSLSDLSSPVTGEHILNDPYQNHPGEILYDISAARPQSDGSYIWRIKLTGTFTNAADIVDVLNQGKAHIDILTARYPNGELSGHFTLVDGTSIFTPPPPPASWADDHSDRNAAARFLIQATFGPTSADIASVQSLGYAGWLSNQFTLPVSHHLPVVLAKASVDPTTPYPSSLTYNTWWRQSVTAPDQLRQRVAFALSEITVVSQNGVLLNRAQALSSYYDTLLDNAFGNYRSLLEAVTLTPAMGLYLNMRGNDKGSIITGIHANENYAREIMQLFSIGLNRVWPDGTLVMNSQGNLVPTYSQNVVMGVAAVFTGWNYHQANQANGRLPTNFSPPANYTDPMVLVPSHHDLGTKLVLDNVMLPAAQGSQADSGNTNFDNYCSQDLESALDSIFNNQNVGPFICRQLIQRLVTSSPSRDYLYRVVQAFNDDGTGVRGNLQAVIQAILLDAEARNPAYISQATYGKQREPLLRVTAPARAFSAPPSLGGTYSQNGSQVISITTTNAHRLNNGDTVVLTFSNATGQSVPPMQGYSVTLTGPSSFNVNAPGLATGTYGQTNYTMTVAISGHGVLAGDSVYLVFTTGGAANGVYVVATVVDTAHFTVATADATTLYGNCLMPKLTGGGFTQSRTNVTVDTTLMSGLQPGDTVFLYFTAAGSPASGQYQVVTVPDGTHFTVIVTNSATRTLNGLTTFPLVPPPLARSGSALVEWSTWSVNATDTGTSSALGQTPLNSPTVFNFFYPSYKFPGALATAGLTTPEFQLTSDTTVASQMNFLEGGVLNNTGNTNGLSSFTGGNGAIVLDLGPWMTPSYTSNAGVPNLVDQLNTLLLGGQLSVGARTRIVTYVANTANFPYTTPTHTQMRDRVRAVVHLLLESPDFTIQK